MNILDFLTKLFNSNFFVGTVTLFVGAFAFRIYKKQKVDAKRDAANVILLEIQSAEQQLSVITKNQTPNTLDGKLFLMKNSSWDKYRYYFARDLDRNEWDKISDFYNKCLEYDAAVLMYSSAWGNNVKSIQTEVMHVLAGYAVKFVEDLESETDKDKKEKLKEDYINRKANFISSYGVIQNDEGYDAPYFYNPQKSVLDAQAALQGIEKNLSLSSVGMKLKILSKSSKLRISMFENNRV